MSSLSFCAYLAEEEANLQRGTGFLEQRRQLQDDRLIQLLVAHGRLRRGVLVLLAIKLCSVCCTR